MCAAAHSVSFEIHVALFRAQLAAADGGDHHQVHDQWRNSSSESEAMPAVLLRRAANPMTGPT
jgi:hypothetical protein